MIKGVCHTSTCKQAISGEPVDLYPGPGEFCPECGEPLEALEQKAPFGTAIAQPRVSASGKSPAKTVPTAEAAPGAKAHVSPAERTQAAASGRAPAAPAAKAPAAAPAALATKKPPAPKPKSGGPSIPAAALAFAGVALLFIAGAVFLLRPHASTPSQDAAVRVCATSITQRLAVDIVAAYAARSGAQSSSFDIVAANGSQLPCDVRFMARALQKADWTVGHDAIVVVVNPLNPVNRITAEQVHGIFAGTIGNWSQLGGSGGAIVAMLPDDASDEGQLLATTLLSGVKIGSGVQRLASSGDVVRAVSSASGRGDIGLVAFSQAVPGKVLALGDLPIPSTLTIADHSYPLSLSVMVTSDDAAPDRRSAGLIKYARSADVQSLVVHSGLVAKEGL